MPPLVCRTLYSLSSTSTLFVAFTLHHSIVKDSLFLSHYQQKRKGNLERGGQVQEEAGQAFGPIPDCPQSLPSSQDAVKFLPVSHQATEGARIQSPVCPTPKTTLICPTPSLSQRTSHVQEPGYTSLQCHFPRDFSPGFATLTLCDPECILHPLPWFIHLDHTASFYTRTTGAPLPPRKQKSRKEGKKGEGKKRA